MPGFQVAGRIGGDNTGIRQQTMSTQRSLFLSPFTTFLSALSDFLFSCFLKREVYFGPKHKNDGNQCRWGFGIPVNYFLPELSFCCCNIIAGALFILVFKKYPHFISLFSTANQWEPKCGEESLEMLPSWYLYWNADSYHVYEISDVYFVGWSWCTWEPRRYSRHFIWPPDLSFIRG